MAGFEVHSFEVVVAMNCFGKYTESTESLIPNEDVSEVIELSDSEIKEDEDQTGEDVEVGEEMEEVSTITEEMEEVKLLTDEELQRIAEEVDKREQESAKKVEEKPDFVAKLLEHCINTILLEELTGVGQRMNAFRKVLADGVSKFAEREDAENSTAKMDQFVDSFRAAWKEWKKYEDAESVVNVFMKEMDNELWYPER